MKIDINFHKKNQRDFARKKRLIINESFNENDLIFCKILNQYDWFLKSNVVATFLSIKSEISTITLNKFIVESGKTLCLPTMNTENHGKLKFKQYTHKDTLIPNKYGVREPINSRNILPDIIFVPCLAYDKFGYRLGYGGGYYDKTISYLYSIKHIFLTVGLAYNDQKVDKVVHDNLDQKLNYILTEKELYQI